MPHAEAKALINYGASVCWPFERFKAMDKYKTSVDDLYQVMRERANQKSKNYLIRLASLTLEPLSPEEMDKTLANIKASLAEGGIGIGVPIGYLAQNKPGRNV